MVISIVYGPLKLGMLRYHFSSPDTIPIPKSVKKPIPNPIPIPPKSVKNFDTDTDTSKISEKTPIPKMIKKKKEKKTFILKSTDRGKRLLF